MTPCVCSEAYQGTVRFVAAGRVKEGGSLDWFALIF